MRKRTWFWGLALVASTILLFRIKGALAPFFIAMLLALLLKPVVDFLEKEKEVPRSSAILISYFILSLIIGLFFFFALPALMRELERAVAELPQQLERVEALLANVLARIRWQIPPSLRGALDQSLKRFEEVALGLLNRGLSFFVGIFLGLPTLVLVPVVTFYFLRDWRSLQSSFLKVLPYPWRRELLLLVGEVADVLVGFVRGEALVCLAVGTMSILGLHLLGVPFAFLLGLLIGFLDFIPFLGPVIGGFPAVLLALIHSPLRAVYVILLLVLVNQLEGAFISPRIMGEHVGLHPLLIIFSLLAGGELLGIWGLVVAVPLAAILKVLGKFLWSRFRSWVA